MGKAKILVVEDNADNVALVRFLLERAGYDVLCAGDGVEALRLARAQLPSLILLDLAIPELDGWQTAQALKADPITQAITIVALTARTLPGDRKRAMAAGCEAYIAKPINIVAFTNEIDSLINKKMIDA